MPSGAKPKIYPADLVSKVADLYAANCTQREISVHLGVPQKVIWNLMRRHGIKARTAAKRNQRGTRNHMWKGDEASKYAFHRRLYSLHGKPSKCSRCGTTESAHYDYANLTGHYEDIADYAPMCRSCHWVYDNKITNITNNRRDAVV